MGKAVRARGKAVREVGKAARAAGKAGRGTRQPGRGTRESRRGTRDSGRGARQSRRGPRQSRRGAGKSGRGARLAFPIARAGFRIAPAAVRAAPQAKGIGRGRGPLARKERSSAAGTRRANFRSPRVRLYRTALLLTQIMEQSMQVPVSGQSQQVSQYEGNLDPQHSESVMPPRAA